MGESNPLLLDVCDDPRVQPVAPCELVLHPGHVGGQVGLTALEALFQLGRPLLLQLKTILAKLEVDLEACGALVELLLAELEFPQPLPDVFLDGREALFLSLRAEPARLEPLLLLGERVGTIGELALAVGEDGGQAVELVAPGIVRLGVADAELAAVESRFTLAELLCPHVELGADADALELGLLVSPELLLQPIELGAKSGIDNGLALAPAGLGSELCEFNGLGLGFPDGGVELRPAYVSDGIELLPRLTKRSLALVEPRQQAIDRRPGLVSDVDRS